LDSNQLKVDNNDDNKSIRAVPPSRTH